MYCIFISLPLQIEKTREVIYWKNQQTRVQLTKCSLWCHHFIGVTRRRRSVGPSVRAQGGCEIPARSLRNLLGEGVRVIFYKSSYSLQYCPRVPRLGSNINQNCLAAEPPPPPMSVTPRERAHPRFLVRLSGNVGVHKLTDGAPPSPTNSGIKNCVKQGAAYID